MEPKKQDAHLMVIESLANGQPKETIELALANLGYDHYQCSTIFEESKKIFQAKKRTKGFTLILVGALICLLSCVYTLATGSMSMSNFTLFGLTTLGVIVVFAGLYMVF